MKKILKSNISIVCAICLIVTMVSGFAYAEVSNTGSDETAYSTVPMYMNGIRMTDGIKIEDTTYVALRAFFNVLENQTDIAWNGDTNTVTVKGDGLELTAAVGTNYMTVNGRCFYVRSGVRVVNSTLVLPVRELAKIYQATVEWDSESSSVSICADNPVLLESGEAYYNEQDLYWLSRLINAESGNQPLDGKIAVGNVVLNRVANPTCPNTIYDVIFDSKYGVQFSVTQNGAIYDEPNEESVLAAKICLEGYNLVGDSIYFVNPQVGVSSWFAKTRVYVATIGQHDFYA